MNTAQAVIILEVVERHRGSDTADLFLQNLRGTLQAMLDGKRVHQAHLDAVAAFCDDLSLTCLAKSQEGRGGCF